MPLAAAGVIDPPDGGSIKPTRTSDSCRFQSTGSSQIGRLPSYLSHVQVTRSSCHIRGPAPTDTTAVSRRSKRQPYLPAIPSSEPYGKPRPARAVSGAPHGVIVAETQARCYTSDKHQVVKRAETGPSLLKVAVNPNPPTCCKTIKETLSPAMSLHPLTLFH